MNDPLVSVIIPTKDRFQLVKAAIQNVRQQSYSNLEIIVIDDGSNIDLQKYVEAFNENDILYYSNHEYKGLASSRNLGTFLAKGRYVAFMDDDDRWLKHKIKLQISLATKSLNNNIMIYCGGDGHANNSTTPDDYLSNKGIMSDYIFKGLTLASSSMLIERDALLAIGGHSEEMISCVDHDLWFKMAKFNFIMDYVPKRLVFSNKIHNSMTGRLKERLGGIQQFFDKWHDYVTSNYGQNSWQNIEEIYHNQIVNTAYSQFKLRIISFPQAMNYLKQIYDLQGITLSLLDKLLFRFGKLHLTPATNKKKNIYKSLLHL